MVEDNVMNGIARLNVQLDDSGELSRRYLSESPYGGLVIDVDSSLSEEDLVELNVGFRETQERYLIKAVVLWRRNGDHGLTVGLGFLPSESEKRERLLSVYRDRLSESEYEKARSTSRYNAVLKVTYRSTEDFVLHFTRNLSSGGMFVSSTKPPPADGTILFQLSPPGESDPLELPGRVVWSDPGNGFGVRFTGVKQETMERLENLVKHVSIGAVSEVVEPVFEQINN